MYHNQVDFEKYVKGTKLAGTPLDKITPEMLACWGADEKWTAEPGDFTIMVGSSSADKDEITAVLKLIP